MKYQMIIIKIISDKIIQKKDLQLDDQLTKQYYQLLSYFNQFQFFKLSSIYFKYNGNYFLYICDNGAFYYLGNKKLNNKTYFILY